MKRILSFIIITILVISLYSCSKSSPNYELILRSAKELSFEGEGGSSTISFYSSSEWKAISSSYWYNISATSGSSGDHTITIECSANKASSSREGTITIQTGDKFETITVKQKEKAIEPINPLINDTWVIKEGLPVSFFNTSEFSNILQFNSAGNFTETAYHKYHEAYELNTYWESTSTMGNWKGGDNKIVLNDLEGNSLKDTLHIVSISNTELKIKYQGKILSYCKASQQFAILKTDLLGRWYCVTSNSHIGYYYLKSDGTISVSLYEKILTQYIGTGYDGTWWLNNNNELITHDNKSAGGYNHTYPISFINKKYLGFTSLVLERH